MFAEETIRDVRVGLRMLAKERGFCALATVVLALGIAAVTTQFSMVNGIMLRGFSFPNAARLADVRFIDPATRTVFGVNSQVSAMDYEEFLPAQKSFELMAGYLNGSTVNMTVHGEPRRYTGAYVTDAFFRILGVSPFKGRDFTAADNRPGAEKVAIIGYGIWQRDFGGAADVLGMTVRLNGKSTTIVGIMPQGFAFPQNEELWIPLYSEFPVRPRNDPQASNPSVIGLLKRGVPFDQAQAEFDGFAGRFAKAYAETNKAFNRAQVEPLIDQFTGTQLRGTMWTMLAFCVGVLLIACVNVMNMQFARATLRARELAVRSAVGATRGRLIRQMVTESALLAGGGAVIGIALAYFSLDWLTATLRNWDNPPPSWMTFDLDLRALLCTVGATVVAALMSGLLPAWMASRARVVDVLREGGRGNTGRGVGLVTRGLVVLQIVVTCVLLIGSLLQLRSILNQQNVDYGYDTAGLMTARMGLMEGDYPSPESRRLFYDRLLRDLQGSGQFASAALTSRFRMAFAGNAPIEIDGKVYQVRRDRPTTNFEQVSGSYFQTIGQKLLEGRTFADDDLDTKLPVAIVNAAFARKHFGAASPIGRRFRTGDGETGPYGPWRTIVGVVATVRMQGPFNNPNVDDSGFYVPFYATPTGPVPEAPVTAQFATVVVRPHPGQQPRSVIPTLRREVAKVDPNLPLYFVDTPQKNLDSFLAGNRILAAMFTVFGVVAIVLAAVGIFGVMSFSVNQRQQEFGVRMALGADRARILGMVLRQGSRQVAVGLAAGLGLALTIAALGRNAIGSILFGVSALDPLTYGTVTALIVAVSLVAVLVPARRATHVDPVVALRAE
jgi:predicted permease